MTCLSVKYLHANKIIHCDINTEHVSITQTGMIKLRISGAAKVLDATNQLTFGQAGDPRYMSPEMIQNKPYSYQADIWGLGVLLYELCKLEYPFNKTDLQSRVIIDTVVCLPSVYSQQLVLLISELLTKTPETRLSIDGVLRTPIILRKAQQLLDSEYRAQIGLQLTDEQVNQIDSMLNHLLAERPGANTHEEQKVLSATTEADHTPATYRSSLDQEELIGKTSEADQSAPNSGQMPRKDRVKPPLPPNLAPQTQRRSAISLQDYRCMLVEQKNEYIFCQLYERIRDMPTEALEQQPEYLCGFCRDILPDASDTHYIQSVITYVKLETKWHETN